MITPKLSYIPKRFKAHLYVTNTVLQRWYHEEDRTHLCVCNPQKAKYFCSTIVSLLKW